MGSNSTKPFKVHMFEADFEMMKDLVLLHPGKETGGNLFGLWTDFQEAVLHVVLGPAIGCTRTEVSFYQDIPYLQRVGKVLTEQFQLCHIGEWHSHHHLRLSEPSTGDSSTVTRNFPRGTCGFILIIANILPDDRVTLSPYVYKEGSSTYERGEIKLLRHRSPFKEVDVIRANIEQDEDRSSTVEEYRLRVREVPKRSAPRPIEKSQKDGKSAYMFKEDSEKIQEHLVVAQGARIAGELLGLWTTDYEPVVHIALEPWNKNKPPPVPLNHQPKVTIQHRGHLVEGYPLENIGRYILYPHEQHEPSSEDSHSMRKDYPSGGVLILAFWHSGEQARKSIAISPYLYHKGSERYEPLPMNYLPGRKVFKQNISVNEGGDKEEGHHEKMEIDEPPASPNFEQHKFFEEK